MNVRDPFNLRRSPGIHLLRLTAATAATTLTQKVLETSQLAITAGREKFEELEKMSFNIPKNVPSFNNPQRNLEDRAWTSSGMGGSRSPQPGGHSSSYGLISTNGGLNAVQEKVGGFFDRSRDLPMYKDKPYSYASSRRQKPIWKRKRVLSGLGLFIFVFVWLTGFFGDGSKAKEKAGKGLAWLQNPESAGAKVDWDSRRESVKDAFKLSWDAYERYGWGYDEFHPVSKRGKQMTPNGMGWIIVDALDTLMLMNLTSRLEHARQWMSTKLDYDQDQEVNTFETTIRMLGGLLSAHYLSTTFPNMAPLSDDDPGAAGEDLYLEKAKDLADRIIGAFDSNSGVPYASVNLKTSRGVVSHDDQGASSTAEAATLQLEFKYLAKLTGERYYWDKAEKVMQVIDDNGMEDGLLPIYIYADRGNFRGENIRLGSRGDSYYEYLIKQYLQTSKSEPIYEEMWDESLAGVRKHLITYSEPSHFTVLGERPNGLHKALSPKMDHLVCFMPGTIALGATGGISEAEARKLPSWNAKKDAEMQLARELTQTCWGMYKYMATGLAAEITHFSIADPPLLESAPHNPPKTFDTAEDAEWRKDFMVKGNDVHNLQRPETVETLFYMWRITGDVMYREWGWEMFKSFMAHTAVEDGGGFTSLGDANKVPASQRDNMESFWLAETLKYFYLLFSENDILPLDQIVINTEAHAFPRFELGPLFSTGWKRKPRTDGKLTPVQQEKSEAPDTQTVTVQLQDSVTKANADAKTHP